MTSEHQHPHSRCPGRVVQAVCENGHRATTCGEDEPFIGYCSECGHGVTWYVIERLTD